MILRKRAEEILDLVKKTESELSLSDGVVAGDIHIGTGETDIVRMIARAARSLRETCPEIHYHISSGNAVYVLEQLDKGLIDFGLVFGAVDSGKYQSLKLPAKDTWGVLMRKGRPARGQRGRRPGGSVGSAAHHFQPEKRRLAAHRLDEAGYRRMERGGNLQPRLQRLPPGGRGAGVRALPG